LFCLLRPTDCNAGETCVYRISDTTNAHAGACSSTYLYRVCCSVAYGTLTAVVQNGGCSQDGAVSLSSTDNAMLEEYSSANYANDVCLSASIGTITCAYSGGSCANVCLGSLSGSTNAHAGECTAYSEKICCSIT
jgi:hypothetical protein